MKKQNRKVAEGLSLSHLPKGLPVVVTGATGGIGAEICRALGLLGVPVIMACRSEKKFAETYERLLKEVPEMKAEFLPLDLTDHASVTGAVDRLHLRHIAGVINNAGTMQRHFTQTAEGVETTMAVNYYNTKLFNQLLLPQIAEGGVHHFADAPRLVASPYAGDRDRRELRSAQDLLPLKGAYHTVCQRIHG